MEIEAKREETAVMEKEEHVKALEETVAKGKVGERLSTNGDWQQVIDFLNKSTAVLREQKIEYYDSLVAKANTMDEKLKAMATIRDTNQVLVDFAFVASIPQGWAEAGRLASDELKKIREGK